MEEKTTPEERNMDRRLVERNLRKGIVSQADIEAYEGKLRDVSDNLEIITIDGDEEEERTSKEDVGTEGNAALVPSSNNAGSGFASVSSITNSQSGA